MSKSSKSDAHHISGTRPLQTYWSQCRGRVFNPRQLRTAAYNVDTMRGRAAFLS